MHPTTGARPHSIIGLSAPLACATASGLALLALVGWGLDLPGVRNLVPGTPGMNPVTAVCLVLASAALWLLRASTASASARFARIAACAVALVGVAELACVAFGIPFPFSGASFHEPGQGAHLPGGMSAHTAASLALLGGALAALDVRTARGRRPAQVALFLVAALAVVTLIGYMYGAPTMYGLTAHGAMAPNTAVALLTLACAGLFARPDTGLAALLLSTSPGGTIARRLLPVGILTPVVIGWLRLEAVRAGLVSNELGGAVQAVFVIAVLVAMIWVTGRALEHSDLERRTALTDVERSRIFLDSVIEHLPHMVFVKDAESLRFVRLNRAGEELLGFSRADLIGKNDYDFFPRDEADFFTSKDRAVLASGEVLLIPREPIETRSQGQRILRTTKATIPNERGEPAYLLGISEDITESIRAEVRETELSEDLRKHATRLAEAYGELESFSYSVSHDLRAPLRHIDGFADLLQRHAGPALDDKSKRYAQVISESAKGMGRLIDDLLSFSRMARTSMNETQVDLNALVSEVRKSEERDAGDRKVTWRVASMPELYGDPVMLRLMFANLISNALKYTSTRSEPVIEIGAAVVNGEVIVHVRDNGVGFDMQYAHKLFGVFQRLHSKEAFDGTGIGLANVRRIVRRHGGRTWAEGKVDEGAVFYVALPQAGAVRDTEIQLEAA